MLKFDKPLSRPTSWKQVIVVCRKCGKKLKGGFGEKRKDSLKSALRKTLSEADRRRDVRVLETSCLGLCPKQGVTAFNASQPGVIYVIPAGTDREDALRTLLGDASDTGRLSAQQTEAPA